MTILIVGLIGASILVAAWAFETIESIRHHKSLVDLRFAFTYIIGVSILFTYSTLIGDLIFISLNALIITFVAIEILYSIHIKKVHKKQPVGKKKGNKA